MRIVNNSLLLLITVWQTVAPIPTGHTHLTVPLIQTTATQMSMRRTPQNIWTGTTLTITPFASISTARNQTSTYFGAAPTYTDRLITIGSEEQVANGAAHTINNYFVRTAPGNDNHEQLVLHGTPQHYEYGATLTVAQQLPTLLFNSTIGVTVPFSVIRSGIAITQNAQDSPLLRRYFAGTYSSEHSDTAQIPVSSGIIDGTIRKNACFPAVTVWLTKPLISLPIFSLDTNVHLSIPLQKPREATYLFGPQQAHNGHYHIGGQLRSSGQVWCSGHHTVGIRGIGTIGYTLPCQEQRIIPFSDKVLDTTFGHYRLITTKDHSTHSSLLPLTHILTQSVSVTPGVSSSLLSELSYRWRCHTVSVIYLYTYHAQEIITDPTLHEALYAFPSNSYTPAQAFADQTDKLIPLRDTHTESFFLQQRHLNSKKAGTPAYTTHSLGISYRYTLPIKQLPLNSECTILYTQSPQSFMPYRLAIAARLTVTI